MKIALVFCGQGSQYVGMGKELFASSDNAQEILNKATDALGGDCDLASLMENGPNEELSLTQNAQPALVTVSIAALEMLKSKFDLSGHEIIAAGHSLGEYSALVASGALSFVDGVKLVRARGEAMNHATKFYSDKGEKGGMTAVLGCDIEQLKNFINQLSIKECYIANDNCAGQIVVSGSLPVLDELKGVLTNAGKRAVPLNVSGAFHSSYMTKAKEEFGKEIEKIDFKPLNFPVLANVSGKFYEQGHEKSNLINQIDNPVLWRDCMKSIIDWKPDCVLELGPKQVLCGLFKREAPEVKCFPIEHETNLKSFLEVDL